jgi:UbiD family decarboxylase
MSIEYRGLRDWLEGVEALGELTRVKNAHWDCEIGAIAALQERRLGQPALLFDQVPDHDPDFRVLTNTMMSNRRIAYTFGADVESSGVDLVKHWRTVVNKMPTLPVEFVADGPVNENVQRGEDVNVLAFPTPRWHEHDGGRYIGTGDIVIMNDPDSDWVNLGCYRVMVHDERTVGLYISPGKHGRLIRERYWDQGKPCPVAVSLGQDPLLTTLAGIEVPYGVSEYEVAGGLRGTPTQVIKSDVTGLPIPADAEIVLEGFLYPGDMREEGPFGEWTGYYAGGREPAPVMRVEAVRHRNQPILYGALTGRSPADAAYYRGLLRAAMIWDQVEGAGLRGIKGVWVHEASGARLWVTVAVEQMFPGHAQQVGLVASQCHAGAYANRFVVVVDDDIDPTNNNDVIWAMCTRMDPAVDMTTITGAWSTPLDPMAYPPGPSGRFNNRVVIDACKPWTRRDTFPRTVEPSEEYKTFIMEKWGSELPGILP